MFSLNSKELNVIMTICAVLERPMDATSDFCATWNHDSGTQVKIDLLNEPTITLLEGSFDLKLDLAIEGIASRYGFRFEAL